MGPTKALWAYPEKFVTDKHSVYFIKIVHTNPIPPSLIVVVKILLISGISFVKKIFTEKSSDHHECVQAYMRNPFFA